MVNSLQAWWTTTARVYPGFRNTPGRLTLLKAAPCVFFRFYFSFLVKLFRNPTAFWVERTEGGIERVKCLQLSLSGSKLVNRFNF